MTARPLKRIKPTGFIGIHASLRVAKTMNRRFILGIFEHIRLDSWPSVKAICGGNAPYGKSGCMGSQARHRTQKCCDPNPGSQHPTQLILGLPVVLIQSEEVLRGVKRKMVGTGVFEDWGVVG